MKVKEWCMMDTALETWTYIVHGEAYSRVQMRNSPQDVVEGILKI